MKLREVKLNHPSSLYLPPFNREAWRFEIEHYNKNVSVSLPLTEEFISKSIEIAKRWAPIEFREVLRATLLEGGPAYASISGLPIDRVLPNPSSDGSRPSGKMTWVTEMALIGILGASGLEPFAYLQERSGSLIQEITPVKGKEKSYSSANSEELGWHSDNAIIPREYQAEGIALYSLINEGTPTRVAIAEDLVSYLSKRDIAELSKAQFQFPLPESFKGEGDRPYSPLRPVLRRNEAGLYEIAVAMYNVRPSTNPAEEAIKALGAVLNHFVSLETVLGPGELLLFNNLRCLHARSKIQGKRWLQRTYVRRNLNFPKRYLSAASKRQVDASKVARELY